MASSAAQLLAAHAALPEPYQPAWGLDASRGVARRECDDRLAAILPPLAALPCGGAIRILDLGCAQGYFTLAIVHELARRARDFEIVGVDYLEDNVRFCEALAAHHRLPAKFLHARVDADFLGDAKEGSWDVVLALNVLHHLQRQQGAVSGALGAIRTHSRVAFCELAQRGEALEWVGEWHPADDELLGAYPFRRRLASFPTHLGDVRRPLYLCSDTQAWVGDHWFEFDHAAERSHAGVPDTFAGQRRFLFGAATVVKAYRGEGDHGAFNRAELDAEADVLASLSDEPGRYPAVLGRADDGDTVWLARGLLRGRLLSACIDAGERMDRAAVVRGLLGELAHLEERGFHHGDLRCWNVLVDEGRVRLIDFGALIGKPSPLHRVALAAMLLEIAESNLRNEQPFYASLHPLSAYPAAWRGLVRYLLEAPQRTFRFARALEALDDTGARVVHGARDTQLAPATDVLIAVAQEQAGGFRRLQEYLAETGRRLAASGKESADAAAERTLLEGARRDAEAHALSLAGALASSENAAKVHAEALGRALDASQANAASLKIALDASKEFVVALQARIARESADAKAEREAMQASQREGAMHAAMLEQARRESEAHALSLAKALAESQAFAASLQARIARESADAKAEREAMQASQREGAMHAATLEQARRESEAHALSLAKALAESQAFAASLRARITREGADARAEREAMLTSQRAAAAHAVALARSLSESQTYTRSLKEALEESRRYAESLGARLDRESADASRERAKLVADVAEWQVRHARMQSRFRLLKFLWPREADDPKEPE